MVDYLVVYVRNDMIYMCDTLWQSASDDALVKAILQYFVFPRQSLLFVTEALYCADFPHNVVPYNLT